MSSVPTYRLIVMAISTFVLLWMALMPAFGDEADCEYPNLARARIVMAQRPGEKKVAQTPTSPATESTESKSGEALAEDEQNTLTVSKKPRPEEAKVPVVPPAKPTDETVPAEPSARATVAKTKPQEETKPAQNDPPVPGDPSKSPNPVSRPTSATVRGSKPKGSTITPSDVYAKLELIQRKLDALLAKQKSGSHRLIEIKARETQVKPMHIYQLHLTCLDQLRAFERTNGLTMVPLIVASPVDYQPGDVYQLTSLLADRLDQIAQQQGVGPLPGDLQSVEGKTPTDVYQVIVPVFCRLLALNQIDQLTPNDVYAQAIRARIDAQAIVSHMAQSQSDSFTRQRHLQARAFGLSGDGNHLQLDPAAIREPKDAFDACVNARGTINQIWRAQNREAMPLPRRTASEKIIPADVYLQTQMLIAELNLLKYTTGATAPTPPTNVFRGQTPAKVYNEAYWANYILEALVPETGVSTQQARRAGRPRS